MISNEHAFSDKTNRDGDYPYRFVDLHGSTLARATEDGWTVDVSFGIGRGGIFRLKASQIYDRADKAVPCIVMPEQKQITAHPSFIER